MTIDSDGLHEIANTRNPGRRADIVFVHGLGGSSHETWRFGREGQTGHFFWPEELGRDLQDCGIWTIGYPGGVTSVGQPGMIIEKRCGNISQKLVNGGLGVRPLLFITHSMGGLILKSLVVGSQTLADGDRARVVGWIRGIVFLATPHRGSSFADAAGVLGTFLGGGQAHVREMRANAEPLDILHDGFIEWHRKNAIPVASYAENIGLFRKGRLGRLVPLGLVVPRASANPGIAGHTIRDVDQDHITLVKPKNRQQDVYAGVLRFITEALLEIPSLKAATAHDPLPSDADQRKPSLASAAPKPENEIQAVESISQPLESPRDSSPFDLSRFRELKAFAYSGSGLNLTSGEATQWAEAHVADSPPFDLDKFKELKAFAYSGSGLNLTSGEAIRWALAKMKKAD